MKSLKFTLISLALLVGTEVYACWYPAYSPGEYNVFYSVETFPLPETDAHIKEWRKLTGNQASLEDIKEVVYHYSLAELENLLLKKETGENSFEKYLRKKNDTEIVNYLLLAKRCEIARAKRNDKWWYPTKEDLKNLDLQEILQEALAYKGMRLKNRYLLQAVRAAYTMKEHDLCIDLWEKQIKKMSNSAVKTMCQGYIGGIYFQRGDYEKAIQFYTDGTDQASFWWCAKNMTKENTDLERIKILYKYQPSSEELALMLDDICRSAESKANEKVFNNNSDYDYKSFQENRKRYMGLRDFALQVAKEKRSNNPAMWQYAAAFLTFLDGKAPLALQYADKAAELDGTPFIKENIKVLQIMLEAYVEKKYDAEFEARFLPKLQWLDSLIIWKIDWTYNDSDTKNNYSQYYPFDMMRKITLSVMVRKYEKQKDYTKALLLAGMASERLRTLSNFKHIQEYCNGNKWNTDYSTDIFNYMNEYPVENVIEYQQLLQSGGRNEFEQFLVSKCYKNNDYFNELIGTKYMRLEKFKEAIPYLSKVSDKYIKSMNVYDYFNRDPFRELYEQRKPQDPHPAYKLNFAKKMLNLQQKMKSEKNKEEKAIATWQYAIALQRSVYRRESWALTSYYMGEGYGNYGNAFNDWQEPLLKRGKTLIAQAGKIMENSQDPAIRAKYDWYKCETYAAFAEKYKENPSVFQPFVSECDNFKSYFIPLYVSEKWDYNGTFK